MLTHIRITIVLLVTMTMVCLSQTTSRQFHTEIVALYSFHPNKLNEQEQKSKSAELDIFWNKVESHQDVLLPFLRFELADMTNPPFFLFDGSQLLLKLSKSGNDKSICLRAMAHCDLDDVRHSEYLRSVHNLACEGLNTTDAAFHILNYPNFKAFFPQHALTLAQDYSFLYMLLPIDESLYLESCITQLQYEKDATSVKTLILLLWYTATKEGDKAIDNVLTDPSALKSSQEYVRKYLTANDNISHNSSVQSSSLSYTELKQERKRAMSRISDEALYELDELTVKIRLAYNKIK